MSRGFGDRKQVGEQTPHEDGVTKVISRVVKIKLKDSWGKAGPVAVIMDMS